MREAYENTHLEIKGEQATVTDLFHVTKSVRKWFFPMDPLTSFGGTYSGLMPLAIESRNIRGEGAQTGIGSLVKYSLRDLYANECKILSLEEQ